MTVIHLDDEGEGRYRVCGDLSFDTVPDLWKRSKRVFTSTGQKGLQIDLGGVQAFDSAGLALLVAWKRWAKHHTRSFTLTQVSPKMIELAKANNLGTLFGLDSVQS